MTKLVIGSPFLCIGENFVSLLGLLEFLLGNGRIVTRVAIRVIFHRQPAIGLLDICFAGIAIDAKHFVVIAI